MRGLVAVVLIAPVALAFVAVQDRGPSVPITAAGVHAAPAAVVAAPTVAVTGLSNDLERLVTSSGWNGDQWSVLVVSLDKGDTLF